MAKRKKQPEPVTITLKRNRQIDEIALIERAIRDKCKRHRKDGEPHLIPRFAPLWAEIQSQTEIETTACPDCDAEDEFCERCGGIGHVPIEVYAIDLPEPLAKLLRSIYTPQTEASAFDRKIREEREAKREAACRQAAQDYKARAAGECE